METKWEYALIHAYGQRADLFMSKDGKFQYVKQIADVKASYRVDEPEPAVFVALEIMGKEGWEFAWRAQNQKDDKANVYIKRQLTH